MSDAKTSRSQEEAVPVVETSPAIVPVTVPGVPTAAPTIDMTEGVSPPEAPPIDAVQNENGDVSEIPPPAGQSVLSAQAFAGN